MDLFACIYLDRVSHYLKLSLHLFNNASDVEDRMHGGAVRVWLGKWNIESISMLSYSAWALWSCPIFLKKIENSYFLIIFLDLFACIYLDRVSHYLKLSLHLFNNVSDVEDRMHGGAVRVWLGKGNIESMSMLSYSAWTLWSCLNFIFKFENSYFLIIFDMDSWADLDR